MAGASTSSTAVRMSHLGELSAAAAENGVAVSFLMAQEKMLHFLLQGAPRAAGHILPRPIVVFSCECHKIETKIWKRDDYPKLPRAQAAPRSFSSSPSPLQLRLEKGAPGSPTSCGLWPGD